MNTTPLTNEAMAAHGQSDETLVGHEVWLVAHARELENKLAAANAENKRLMDSTAAGYVFNQMRHAWVALGEEQHAYRPHKFVEAIVALRSQLAQAHHDSDQLSANLNKKVADYLSEKACCSGIECGCGGVTRLQQLVQEEAGTELGALRARLEAAKVYEEAVGLGIARLWKNLEAAGFVPCNNGWADESGKALNELLSLREQNVARLDNEKKIVFDTLAEVEALEEAFVEQFYGRDAEPSACQRTLAGLRAMLEHRLGYSPEAKK